MYMYVYMTSETVYRVRDRVGGREERGRENVSASEREREKEEINSTFSS